MKKIVVLDDYEDSLRRTADWSPVEKLARISHYTERLRGDALVDAVKDANAIVLVRDRTPFKADLLAKIPGLELFIFTGGRNTQLDFAALVARTTAPAGPDLAAAAQTACTDIGAAYGTSQVAIDQRAALTQLQRSVAVLEAARNDLADVTGTAGAHLRSAIAAAIGVLSTANHAVDDGASPATTTTRAFDQATALLRDGFHSAGVVCPVPGA